MTYTLNGQERALEDGLTVAALLEALALSPRKVAVERNREIVPKSRYEAAVLQPGDAVEIVTFVGGG